MPAAPAAAAAAAAAAARASTPGARARHARGILEEAMSVAAALGCASSPTSGLMLQLCQAHVGLLMSRGKAMPWR